MKLKDIHDQVKNNYENGKYDNAGDTHRAYNQQQTNILRRIYPVWIVLLLLTLIPTDTLVSFHLGWLHLVFRIFWMLNTIVVASFLIRDSLMKRKKSDNE